MQKINKGLDLHSSELLLVLDNISEYAIQKSRKGYIPLFNFALKEIIHLMDAKAGNIRLFDTSIKKLLLLTSYGTSRKYRKMKSAIGVGESIAGYVFKTGKIYFSENLKTNHLYAFPELALKENINSLVCIPLLTREKKFGVLSIYYPEQRKFIKEEMNFFSILGTFLSTFLSYQTAQYQLHQIYINIATILINILEEKDKYMKSHSERVKKIALKIAIKMKLPKDKIQIILDFGILHDIGKFNIDNSILNKPGPLNRDEWEIIKKHPLDGARIISPIEEYIKDISFVKYHHEKINGNGYPAKLKGAQIPVLARIFTVADAFEAMISDRPYRKALSPEQIKKELIKNAGKQFDETIVNITLDLMNSEELNEFIQPLTGSMRNN
ncbi:MAG: HD domain-containing protein [Candidatus Omnitrophica bacterium]|nr:HD domain-containing protein [Candidatus Omnitrophota bacterium]